MINEKLKRDSELVLMRERIADRMNTVIQICETCLDDIKVFETTVAKNELCVIVRYANEVKAKAIPTRYGRRE